MKVSGLVSLLTLLIIVLIGCFDRQDSYPTKSVGNNQLFGLEPIDCWFNSSSKWPKSSCYNMHVPENHAKPDGKIITFPVVIFLSNTPDPTKAPLLHLGGGGPGGPMYLDDDYNVQTIWEYHDEMSILQGRNLIVIDPRGVGFSQPSLSCDIFIKNQIKRFEKNLTLTEIWQSMDQDQRECINNFKKDDIDFSAYNSISVAKDIELLRTKIKVDQWVLYGVSYASVYAQIIASQFPSTVESMVLDSATFPNIKWHDNYNKYVLAPYEAIYNYCDKADYCHEPLENFAFRYWSVYEQLNRDPLTVSIDHPFEPKELKIVLNGERFLAAIFQGVYGKQIFNDIPTIITDLEKRKYKSITPYLNDYASYLLDPAWADISAETHYCYDDKPYIDFERVKSLTDQLPHGYIRNTAKLALDWPDKCGELNISNGNPDFIKDVTINTPTLFLHGEHDPITPLRDVNSQIHRFPNSHLITYDLSHDVMSNEECVEEVSAKFINNHEIEYENLTCD